MDEKKIIVVEKVKDFGENHPVITAVAVMLPFCAAAWGIGWLAGEAISRATGLDRDMVEIS